MNLFTIENPFLRITLSDLGATWLSCVVKMPNEEREVLITTSAKDWQKQTAFFGATIGRYANRIANAEYSLNGKTYRLAKNNGNHNLHGGTLGGDKVVWKVESQSEQAVKFSYIFADNEEGFGGEVKAFVEYRLTDNELQISFDATTNQDTPLCLTNHAYFNLQGSENILAHKLMINAEAYLPVDSSGIPNAPLKKVEGTGFDFRTAKKIGQDLLTDDDQKAVKGYDHAFHLAKNSENLTACLTVEDLKMELRTSMPALQVYTGNWLKGQPNLTNGEYGDYAGVALEPEFFPNSVNQPELLQFGGITKAGENYHHTIGYRFII
ncbi:galactose-1-epimerase [Mannheimia varigena]|uniref:galactose-1-epimerase n=1 Tax=Mannheimia varigena TaxID=85404 RepID=UPI0003E32864|nr:galactose-1-epimerase [Mannheimia varigena]AHG77305.1 Aldose 1-epimerase [Mannheimia varigena USDA-ARS-USMARC-1312]